ncbi:hypothetical protein ACHAXT_009300 [Thalassiosira profunda]
MASSSADVVSTRWFDRVATPLNACSLETFAPIPVADGDGEGDGSDTDGDRGEVVVPLVIGCYQLNEQTAKGATPSPVESTNGEEAATKSSRSGELRLHMIPSALSAAQSMRFGDARVVEMESGVLDGKWRQKGPSHTSIDGSCNAAPLFASACASGRIHLHALEKDKTQTWTLSHVAASVPSTDDDAALCLALAWDDFESAEGDISEQSRTSDRIVSSYSNGTVALHAVSCAESEGDGQRPGSIAIEETHRWNAHAMFGCPSEVWTCSFIRGNENVVLSGADDCTLKMWDTRQTLRPSLKIGDSEFEAGVTAISAHPTLDHIFAAGSYDESVRLYDNRKMDRPLAKVGVGGGVWRIKWHPGGEAGDLGKMLVAAMHGGCRVVDIPTLGSTEREEHAVQMLTEFTAHESMAYGADWLWFGAPTSDAVASCSFYDRQAFLWDPYNR